MTVFLVLAVPALALCWRMRSRVHWRAFIASVSLITALGSCWSAVLSAQGWWSFSGSYRTGITLGPHLLLEEFLFYPCGGALSILLYVLGEGRGFRPAPRVYTSIVSVGTAMFLLLLARTWPGQPYYLMSLIVLYNGLVTLPLAPWAAGRIGMTGFALSTTGMATIGMVWDVFAFRSAWWTYHAGTGIMVAGIPLDDFDFFLFAPAAAISIYVCAVSAFGAVAHAQRESVGLRLQEG